MDITDAGQHVLGFRAGKASKLTQKRSSDDNDHAGSGNIGLSVNGVVEDQNGEHANMAGRDQLPKIFPSNPCDLAKPCANSTDRDPPP